MIAKAIMKLFYKGNESTMEVKWLTHFMPLVSFDTP